MGEIVAIGPMPEAVQGDNPLGRLMDLDSLITHRLKLTIEDTEKIFKEIEEQQDVIKAVYTFA